MECAFLHDYNTEKYIPIYYLYTIKIHNLQITDIYFIKLC